MKRNLFVFGMILGLAQSVFAQVNEAVPIKEYDIARDKCDYKTEEGSTGFLYMGTCNSENPGFYAQDCNVDGSVTLIKCILGTSCYNGNTQRDYCWQFAHAGSGYVWNAGYQLQECTGGKWTSYADGKMKVLVVNSSNEDKVIKNYKFDRDNPQWDDQIERVWAKYHEDLNFSSPKTLCYAWICENGTYGCPNGTCPPAGRDCATVVPVPDNSTECDSSGCNTSNPYYKNTFKKYRNMLKNCK